MTLRSTALARRARRTFIPEFKAQAVLDVLTGSASQAEVCRKHQISPTLFALWKATLLERLPTVFQRDQERSAEAARIAELEQLVGQQALELAALKKPRPGWVGPRATAGCRDTPRRRILGPLAVPAVRLARLRKRREALVREMRKDVLQLRQIIRGRGDRK